MVYDGDGKNVFQPWKGKNENWKSNLSIKNHLPSLCFWFHNSLQGCTLCNDVGLNYLSKWGHSMSPNFVFNNHPLWSVLSLVCKNVTLGKVLLSSSSSSSSSSSPSSSRTLSSVSSNYMIIAYHHHHSQNLTKTSDYLMKFETCLFTTITFSNIACVVGWSIPSLENLLTQHGWNLPAKYSPRIQSRSWRCWTARHRYTGWVLLLQKSSISLCVTHYPIY